MFNNIKIVSMYKDNKSMQLKKESTIKNAFEPLFRV